MNRAERRAQAATARRVAATGTPRLPRRLYPGGKYAVSGQLDALMAEIEGLRTTVSDKVDRSLDLLAQAVAETIGYKSSAEETRFDLTLEAMSKYTNGGMRAAVVHHGFYGATEETVDDILAKEIVRRSGLRGDISLALSCLDRMALTADTVRKAGGDFVEAAHREFRVGLGGDAGREICERLALVSWRQVTMDTFEDIAVSSVLSDLDRSAQIALQFSMLEGLNRTKEAQELAEDGFVRRVEEEVSRVRQHVEISRVMQAVIARVAPEAASDLKLLSSMSDEQVEEIVTACTIAGDWPDLRDNVVKCGWKGATAETVDDVLKRELIAALRGYLREAVIGPAPGGDADTSVAAASDSMGEASDFAGNPIVQELTKQFPGTRVHVHYKADAAIVASTFDHVLMRTGAALWKETQGKKPAEVDAAIKQTESSFAGFALAWADHAFQRISTSHTFAAALMCSDADAESLASIGAQWRAFIVHVPNGLLKLRLKNRDIEFRRILVQIEEATPATDDDPGAAGAAEIVLVDFSAPGEHLGLISTYGDTSIAALLGQEVPDTSHELTRIGIMARRLVAGLLLTMQERSSYKERAVERTAGRPGRDEGAPAHRIVTVGHPIKVDCREAVDSYLRHGRSSRGGHKGLPQVQWLVRGHYRQQVCGVGRLGRKTVWIKPHWKGRADAPILTRARSVGS